MLNSVYTPIVVLLFLLVFPLVFTSWGWKRVTWPFLKWFVPKAWAVLIALMWIGFAAGFTANGYFYRLFGINYNTAFSYIMPVKKYAQHARWKEENDTTPEGHFQKDWRQHRYWPALPPDWDGDPPIESLLPPWSLIVIVAGGIFVIGKLKARARAKEAARPPPPWASLLHEAKARRAQLPANNPPTDEGT